MTSKLFSLITFLTSAGAAQVLAADVLAKYTFEVDHSGYGSVRILSNGTVRGSLRYRGKPSSFSARIVDGSFRISVKSRAGTLIAQCEEDGQELRVDATLGDEPISFTTRRFNGEKPSFLGKRAWASVTVADESESSSFAGKLNETGGLYTTGFRVLNGNFIPAGPPQKNATTLLS